MDLTGNFGSTADDYPGMGTRVRQRCPIRRVAAGSLLVGAALGALAGPAAAHGTALVVRISTTGSSAGSLTVNARVSHLDGDPAVAARVRLVATDPSGQVRTARLAATTTPGDYRTLVRLAPGSWRLVVDADLDGTQGRASAAVVVGATAPSPAATAATPAAADPAPAQPARSVPGGAAVAVAAGLLVATAGAALVVRRTRRNRSVGGPGDG